MAGGDSNTDWTKRAWVPKYYNIDGFIYADSLGGRGLAQLVAFKDLWNMYEENDIRYSQYNVKKLEDWYFNNPASVRFGKRAIDTLSQQDLDTYYEGGTLCTVTTKFFYGKTDSDPSYNGNSKDRMKFRLAETYLLRAEALIQLGRTGEAAEMINTVRRRAGATEISATEATLDFLLDERVCELLGEELRRFTLVRTGKLLDRVKKYNLKSASKIKDHHILWPIPQDVIDSNSGIKFPQNDGY
ncbi:MAG: RagB/SusD family nutrient uptake outer membrane protein [Odoribacter sp.]|nr:RagB/SusD family nutrient uptake outer membrane protein [Odoribacter sp.]